MSDDRAAVYLEGDTTVYRASSVNLCSRALIALRMGFDWMAAPEWLQERFQQGHDLEVEVLQRGAKEIGLSINSSQREITVDVMPNVIIRGHIDGEVFKRLSSSDRYAFAEAKALAQSTWDKWKRGGIDAFPYYRDQVTCYMEGLELPCFFIVARKNEAMDGIEEVDVVKFDEPPGDINLIKKKLIQVEIAGRQGKLPGDCGDEKSWPCPVYYLPGHDTAEERTFLEGNQERAIEALAEAYDEGRALEQRGKEMKKAAGNKIAELFDVVGDKVESTNYVVTKVEHPGYPRIDRKALEEAGVDVEQYTTRNPYSYPKVTRKGEGG